MRLTFFLPLLPLALLSACGGDPETGDDDGRSATGEVLEGTISDAMLPLATATSQPPLLAPEQGESGRGAPAAGSDGVTGEEAAAGDDAAADPAAEEPTGGSEAAAE